MISFSFCLSSSDFVISDVLFCWAEAAAAAADFYFLSFPHIFFFDFPFAFCVVVEPFDHCNVSGICIVTYIRLFRFIV